MFSLRKFLALLCVLLLPNGVFAAESPVEEATAILERWTSFHWGRDCIVWVVHYPEELVTPWVEAEAARSGMSQEEKDEYRRSFVKELRIAETEPFLMTVYAFGPKPLSLAPLSGSMLLSLPDGQSIAPTSYEKKFDEPLTGVVQGLVFFPKQPDKRFVVMVKGLGIRGEQEFAFAAHGSGNGTGSPVADPVVKEDVALVPKARDKSKPEAGGSREGIVVSLPPVPKSEKKQPVAPERPQPPVSPDPPVPPGPTGGSWLAPWLTCRSTTGSGCAPRDSRCPPIAHSPT